MANSNSDPQSAFALYRMVSGNIVAQALYVAADLGIADYLKQDGLTVQQLGDKTASNIDGLSRLLGALVALGVLSKEADDRFTLTPVGELLRSDVPGSMRSAVLFLAARSLGARGKICRTAYGPASLRLITPGRCPCLNIQSAILKSQ